MAHGYTRFQSFTVTKSNPSGNIVRFTVGDTPNDLSDPKMIRMVLQDAIQQWINSERADLDSNGDTDVTGEDTANPGNGFAAFNFVYGSKYAQVTLTALTSISSTGTITAAVPFSDVV